MTTNTEDTRHPAIIAFEHSQECGRDCIYAEGRFTCKCGYTLVEDNTKTYAIEVDDWSEDE